MAVLNDDPLAVDACPDWCNGEHGEYGDPRVRHATDWEGVTTDDGTRVLVRDQSGEDGEQVTAVSACTPDGREVIVTMSADDWERFLAAIRPYYPLRCRDCAMG